MNVEASDSAEEDPIGGIVEEFIGDFRAGKAPEIDDFAERYPAHADEIRDLIPTLMVMERARDLEASEEPALGLASSDPGMVGRVLGDYRIVREIGRGGMGVVYEAEQVSLDRRVALKILPQQFVLDPKQRRRFEREARSAARLHHTNIVPVFGVGCDEGVSYFVMQYINGLGLDEVLHEIAYLRSGEGEKPVPRGDVTRVDLEPTEPIARDLVDSICSGRFQTGASLDATEGRASAPDADEAVRLKGVRGSEREAPEQTAGSGLSNRDEDDSAGQLASEMLQGSGASHSGFRGSDSSSSGSHGRNNYFGSVARIGCQVADALQYAHEQGVTHRDIKPGNLLLDLTGTVWVTDFGLAKAEDQQNLTHTGDLLGTLRYMPPEAFEGVTDPLGDVYSLGITLYELLMLRPAFPESDRRVLIRKISQGEFPRLSAIVPRDLATIIHKAIEIDPGDRYQSAQLFQDDMQRFLRDEPIEARRPTAAEKLLRWARRNRALAASLSGILMLLMFIAVFMSVAAIFYRSQEEEQRNLYVQSQALVEQNSGLLEQNRKSLEKAIETSEDLNQAIYLAQMSIAHQSVDQHRGLARTVDLLDAWRPGDGREDLRGWEWYYIHSLCRRERFSLAGHTDTVQGLDWSQDGLWLASASKDGSVRVWDQQRRRLEKSYDGMVGQAICVAFSPDSRYLAAGGSEAIIVWDMKTGEEKFRQSDTGPVFGVAWNVDQSRLAYAVKEGEGKNSGLISLVNARQWATFGKITQTKIGQYNATIDWNPTGTLLAIPSQTAVVVWDLQRGVRRRVLREPVHQIQGVAFDPTGQGYVAAGGRDGNILLWDLIQSSVAIRCLGHTHAVSSIAWHPKGNLIASSSWDGTARLWDANTGEQVARFNCHPKHCFSIAWNPKGTVLATAGDDHLIKFWDPRLANAYLSERVASPLGFRQLETFPDDERVLVTELQGRISIWNANDLTEVETAPLPKLGSVRQICLDAEGERLFHFEGNRLIAYRVDGERDSVVYEQADQPARWISRGGAGRDQWIAAVGANGPATIWDAESGKIVERWGEEIKQVASLSLSPDGRYLGMGTRKGRLCQYDLRTSDRLDWQGEPDEWVQAQAWSPDSRYLAIAVGPEVLLRDSVTGVFSVPMKGHHEEIVSLDWSPDQQRLLSGDTRGTVIVWDPKARRKTLVLSAGSGRLAAARWSHDGKKIISERGGEMIIWDASSGYSDGPILPEDTNGMSADGAEPPRRGS